MPSNRAESRLTLGVALAAVVLVFAWRLFLAWHMRFGPDEMEHLHASWCVSQGMVPYRDFFEHHPPGFYALLAPGFALTDVAQSFANAWTFMLAGRAAMWLLALVAVALTYEVGRLWRGATAGAWAALWLASSALFVERSTELRPDGPALVALLLAVVAWLRALAGGATAARRALFLASGVALGLGLLFTQKHLFLWPAFGLAALHRIFTATSRRAAIVDALAFGAGALTPLVATVAVFASLGAAHALVYYTFLLNVGWKARVSVMDTLPHAVAEAPHLWSFGVVGLMAAVDRQRRRSLDSADVLLFALALAALAGLRLLPIARRQYYLVIIAPLAILAGAAVDAAWAGARAGSWREAIRSPAALVALVGVCLAPFLMMALGETPAWAATVVFGAAVVLALILGPRGAPLVMAAVLFESASALRVLERRNNVEREREMRFVHLNSAPCDTVLDGFKGAGAFRPHASYFYFVHDEIQNVLGGEARRALQPWLEGRAAPPHVVLLDGSLTTLSPKIVRFVDTHYRPAATGSLVRVHVFDDGPGSWRDDEVRRLVRTTCHGPSSLLLDDGWEEAGNLHRLTRGDRAVLGFPLHEPASGALGLRLRADGRENVRARVLVNGNVAGSFTARPAWSEEVVSIDERWWDPETNEIVLRLLDGGRLAVEWVRFEPRR
jgi:hypothetical protein